MEELSKFEALWSEIRQSQYLTEKELEKINNLLEELKSLNSSNNNNIESYTKLYDITNKLLLNLQAVNQNFNKNVENLNKTIANSIQNISTKDIELTIQGKLYSLKKELEKEIKKLNDEIKENKSKEKVNLEKIERLQKEKEEITSWALLKKAWKLERNPEKKEQKEKN